MTVIVHPKMLIIIDRFHKKKKIKKNLKRKIIFKKESLKESLMIMTNLLR